MRGAVVEAVEHGARLQRHMADAVILAHELPDGVEAVEPHQRLELDLAAEVAPHQVDVAEAGYAPRLDAGDHLAADDALIGVGILRRGPSAPETADHFASPFSFFISASTPSAISPIFASAAGSSAFIHLTTAV